MDCKYWTDLDTLVAINGFTIERPKGSAHPKYPDYIYPLDYGYIPNTKSGDGAEIDAWQGSQGARVTGIVATYDAKKKDMEVKVLIGCSTDEKQLILDRQNQGAMSAIIIHRE